MGAEAEATDGSDPSPRDGDYDWSHRLHAVGGPSDEFGGAIEPDTPSWNSMLLLLVAADEVDPERRRAAAEELLRSVFSHPVPRQRLRILRESGADLGEIEERAVGLLFEAVHREERAATYDELVGRISYFLGSAICDEELGEGWRGRTRADDDGPSFESVEAREEDGRPLEGLDLRLARFDARLTLRTLIARADLTDAEREALLHRELHGRSTEETAEAMGSTPGSVRALKSKALSKIRDAADAA